MAVAYKILAQLAPAATTDTLLYTVPTSTSAVASTLVICNSGVSATFRVATLPVGDTLGAKNYIVYEATVNQGDSIFLSLGLTLAAQSTVRVYASTATLSFGLFGSEIT